jgi:exodeoxyribonuclease VII small subunit
LIANKECEVAESKRTRKKTSPEMPFEKALVRVEEIVETLESGDPTLEESLALFEEGVVLSRQCNKRLDAAERRLEVLGGKDGEGSLAVDTLDEDEFLSPSGDDSE